MHPKYHTINIALVAVTTDEPEVDVPCGSCSFCCEKLSPFLSPEEISSGIYPVSFVNPPENSGFYGPAVVLFRNHETGGCGMFKDGKCTIYDKRPKACRQFDCRKQHHPKIPDMVSS